MIKENLIETVEQLLASVLNGQFSYLRTNVLLELEIEEAEKQENLSYISRNLEKNVANVINYSIKHVKDGRFQFQFDIVEEKLTIAVVSVYLSAKICSLRDTYIFYNDLSSYVIEFGAMKVEFGVCRNLCNDEIVGFRPAGKTSSVLLYNSIVRLAALSQTHIIDKYWEESAELIRALADLRFSPTTANYKLVLDEIADVHNMVKTVVAYQGALDEDGKSVVKNFNMLRGCVSDFGFDMSIIPVIADTKLLTRESMSNVMQTGKLVSTNLERGNYMLNMLYGSLPGMGDDCLTIVKSH